MGEENKMLQPRDTLHLLRIALADVVASLGEIPKYADRYAITIRATVILMLVYL